MISAEKQMQQNASPTEYSSHWKIDLLITHYAFPLQFMTRNVSGNT